MGTELVNAGPGSAQKPRLRLGLIRLRLQIIVSWALVEGPGSDRGLLEKKHEQVLGLVIKK